MPQSQSSESSSWFRFGSKRFSRYQQQQQQQQQYQQHHCQSQQSLTVLQESAEEQVQPQHQQPIEVVRNSEANGVTTAPLHQDVNQQFLLQDKDIAAIAQGATREALLNYAVPRHMTRRDCEQLLRSLQGSQVREAGFETDLELKEAA